MMERPRDAYSPFKEWPYTREQRRVILRITEVRGSLEQGKFVGALEYMRHLCC